MRELRIKLLHEHFPVGDVVGMVTQDNQGNYMIVINADLSPEKQEESFLHEMRHIYRNDFQRVRAGEVEEEAHGKIRS